MSISLKRPPKRLESQETKPLKMTDNSKEILALASSLKATSLQDSVWDFFKHSPNSPSLEPAFRPRKLSQKKDLLSEFQCCDSKFDNLHELLAHVDDVHGQDSPLDDDDLSRGFVFETEDFTVEASYEHDDGYVQDDEDGFDMEDDPQTLKEPSPESLLALLKEESCSENSATTLQEKVVDLSVDLAQVHLELPFALEDVQTSPVHISMHEILELKSSGHDSATDEEVSTSEDSDDWITPNTKRKSQQLSASFFGSSVQAQRDATKQRLKMDSGRIFAPLEGITRPKSTVPTSAREDVEVLKRSDSVSALDSIEHDGTSSTTGYNHRQAAMESDDEKKDWFSSDSDEEYHDFYDMTKGRRRRRDKRWGMAPPGPVATLVNHLIPKKEASNILAQTLIKEKKIVPVADGHVAVQQYHAQTLNIPSLIQSSVYTTHDGERRYKCPHQGCHKEYKNPGGIKYHMQHAHFVDTGDEELNVVIKRPYGCTVKGCNKRYRNLGGLKYHIEHSHDGK